MPPKTKVEKEKILSAAVALVRRGESLNARGLAKELGCSTQPIFSNYGSMEEVKLEVVKFAQRIYGEYLERAMKDETIPKYKGSGLGYIRFAREEPKLFEVLFMRNRSGEKLKSDEENEKEIEPILEIIMKNLNLSKAKAYDFHIKMWVFVHGLASMIATGYLNWSEDMVSVALTDEYKALSALFSSEN